MHADQHDTQIDDEALDRALQSLPAELLPARDLWPALEERLVGLPGSGGRRRNFSQGWRPWREWRAWTVAAAAVLAALWFMPSAQSPLPLPLPLQPPLSQQAMTAEMLLIQTYEQQKAQQLATLTPSAAESWAPYLGMLDAAVAQVRYALSFYPEEPALLKQLDKLYRQELLYLQEVALNDAIGGVFYPGATP
ncbi:MAG: hypothetical protein AAB211_02730 [Pseudomonadota bacterium]